MQFTVAPGGVGKRLDHHLLELLPSYSRARLQSWIKEGRVLLDGSPAKSSHMLRGGELIDVSPAEREPLRAAPEDLPVAVLYEDPSVIAVNKPEGLVVHAGAGVDSGTLVNRLVHRFQSLSQAGGELRPGIVHRLDKGTSGVLLVARNDASHRSLAEQFAQRSVEKTYLALAQGRVRDDAGRIAKPIARDPKRRTRMTAALESGRPALTMYRVRERFENFTYLEVRIGTGRTHQIRVHLANLGHPVAGDRLYGAKAAERIFLHAWKIGFVSPATGEHVEVQAPLPPELEQWLAGLRII